jgi:hypothetical protein
LKLGTAYNIAGDHRQALETLNRCWFYVEKLRLSFIEQRLNIEIIVAEASQNAERQGLHIVRGNNGLQDNRGVVQIGSNVHFGSNAQIPTGNGSHLPIRGSISTGGMRLELGENGQIQLALGDPS